MGRTCPDGQNITGHGDMLLNEKKAFYERQYLCILRQIRITLTFIKHKVIFPHKSGTTLSSLAEKLWSGHN